MRKVAMFIFGIALIVIPLVVVIIMFATHYDFSKLVWWISIYVSLASIISGVIILGRVINGGED